MAEDWDLYAVVRSCAAARANRSTGTAVSKSEQENNNNNNHLACLASLIFDEDDGDQFGFPDLEQPRNNAFEELDQLYRPFFPTGEHSDLGGFGFESQCHAPPRKKQKVVETTSSGDVFGAKHRTGCVRREAHHRGIHEEAAETSGSVLPMVAATPLPPPQISPRLRKRKSHQKRIVCEVTAENISSDMWAWRKYGQKPIKGSPYPRNYYRCSSSKGCSARKQVEKSTTDPNIFIVTYTGDHIHPRPTHRNSLAGSTRNKLSGAAKPASQDPDQPNNSTNNDPSCSSALSAASLSPRTPLSSPAAREEDRTGDDNLDDDDMLIPNPVMSEDIFMGLQELGYGSGFGLLKPKLEPSCTAAGGGGC